MWVTSLGLAGEAGIFASLPFYPMFSGVPNGPLRLSPPQVHAAVHNSGDKVHNNLVNLGRISQNSSTPFVDILPNLDGGRNRRAH